jgi:hypothetical protein
MEYELLCGWDNNVEISAQEFGLYIMELKSD